MNILIMGPAGAGKGTMSDLIIKEFDIPHISTGDMLRENVRNSTELGLQAKEFMNTGDITGIVLTKLDGTAKGGCILSIRRQLGIPVKYIGVGEGIDDMEKFDTEEFIRALFE